jgi:hypothetical protein
MICILLLSLEGLLLFISIMKNSSQAVSSVMLAHKMPVFLPL